MTLQGFDKSYYLNAKLEALQVEYPEWEDKDADFLETVLLNVCGFTAEMHYTQYGYMEGLSPNKYFNHDEYRFAKATDMLNKGVYTSLKDALDAFETAWEGDVYQHYLQYGAKEGINPSNSFDESEYLADKLAALQASIDEDVAAEWADLEVGDLRDYFAEFGITALQHYIDYGEDEGLTVTVVPDDEMVDPSEKPWELPHDRVELPLNLQLDWVDNTEIQTYPYSAIGQLVITNTTECGFGTAFMISPEHVLTNAHVLLGDNGNFDTSSEIEFYPGLSGVAVSADSYDWNQVWLQTTFAFDSNLYFDWPNNDLAIIQLNDSIGYETGYLEIYFDIEDNLSNLSVSCSGYPVRGIKQDDPDTQGQDYYQWEVTGTIDSYVYNSGVFEMSDSMSVTPGSSGSPVFYSQNNDYYFTGVLAGYIDETLVAAALDEDSYNWILGILQQDGYYSDYAFA